ncbi:MAG: hypothetical protein HZA58_08885 [Acidimicrobiia bacterium]|nr:hypothetical protein [Acidimicrobiia bacterium]
MGVRSGLTRGFDLSYASNRFVLAVTPGAGLVAGVVTLLAGDGWEPAVRSGIGAGGLTFLAWALTRELHPDRVVLATVAAVLAPFALLIGDPDLLAAATVMLVARMVAGTTGRAIHWFDVALIVVIAAPVAWRVPGPGVLAASALAVALVISLQDRRRSRLAVASVVLAVLAGYAWWRTDFVFESEIWMASVAVVAALAVVGPRHVAVGTDRLGGTVSPRRVQAARGYALIAAGAAAATADPAAMAAVWVALAVIGADAAGSFAIRNSQFVRRVGPPGRV